jgi:hypothetical protein
MSRVLPILLLAAGCAIGRRFADIDQSLPLLEHRSILTHGFLLPLLLVTLLRRGSEREHGARLFTIGFLLASAVHLAFDLFPRDWSHGSIVIPMWGRTSPMFSFAWMAVGIVVCLDLAIGLIQAPREGWLCAVAAVAVFAITAQHEPYYALTGGAALVVAAVVCAPGLRRRHV